MQRKIIPAEIKTEVLAKAKSGEKVSADLQPVKDAALKAEIDKVWISHPAYGHKRMGLELNINHKRALRVMKIFGIKPPRRKSHFYTTRSTSHHTYTNLIKSFVPARSHELWCSDLSYIKFQGRFWYLATIEDIFTRQIVGVNFGKYHFKILDLRSNYFYPAIGFEIPEFSISF